MRRIAITGGIAEGKSTILEYIRDSGFAVESIDALARAVFDTEEVQQSLAELIGEPAPVERARLRARLSEPDVRRGVNRITHPRILEAMRASEAQVVEVPLLIETCLQAAFDRVWVVTCGPEKQLERLVARLGSEEAARGLLATQLPTRAKIPFADRIIRTNEDEATVKRVVTVAVRREL